MGSENKLYLKGKQDSSYIFFSFQKTLFLFLLLLFLFFFQKTKPNNLRSLCISKCVLIFFFKCTDKNKTDNVFVLENKAKIHFDLLIFYKALFKIKVTL